jgi:protein-disulfide isomerase
MRIIILCSLVFLASCTAGVNTNKPSGTDTSYQGTKPTISIKQSSSTTITNGMVATPTYGTGKAQVEIFADFQCPACILSNESIMPIFEEYAANGKLTITFRQFPLTMHKNAK